MYCTQMFLSKSHMEKLYKMALGINWNQIPYVYLQTKVIRIMLLSHVKKNNM